MNGQLIKEQMAMFKTQWSEEQTILKT